MKEYGPYAHRDPGVDPRLPPLGVIFWQEAVEDAIQSAKDGVPSYDDVTYCRLLVPGAPKSFPIYEVLRVKANGTEKIDRRVMDRFKAAFEQYREKRSPAVGGTPLEEWPAMTATLVARFKDANVFTVQQLAILHDEAIDRIRGVPDLHKWRGRAQAWLQDGHGSAEVADLRAQIAELQKRLDTQGKGISEQIAQNNGLPQGFEKRRGTRRARSEGDDIPVELPEDEEEMEGASRL